MTQATNASSSWALSLPAPAKLNLMLHITGRRDDGYHQLQTVFQFLEHSDQLYFNPRSDGKLKLLTHFAGLPAQDNLIIRAAALLQDYCSSPLGADIAIDKILPCGGGLGGGSSNAATTLVALNQLWQCGLSIEQLTTLGLSLGADVPVFIGGFAAWAEGVGEVRQPISPTEHHYLVIHPGTHVSTAEIFSHKDLTRDSKPIRFATALVGKPRNDCQSLVSKLYPEVGKALRWASQFGPTLMTGTGACIFIHFDNLSQAEKIQYKVPSNWHSFVAKGANSSPLYRAMHSTNEATRT